MCSLDNERFLPLHLPWWTTPLQLQVHLLCSLCPFLILMFLLLFENVNGLVLIILFLILSLMIGLLLSPVCPAFVFYIYTQVLWESYIGTVWKQIMGEQMNALVLEEHGSWPLHLKILLWVVAGFILWSITYMVQWIGTRSDLLPKIILRLMAWITLRLFTSCSVELYHVLFSIVVNLSWPLFQLNVKNAFLYGDLKEEVYMKQAPGYVAHGRIKFVVSRRQYIDSSRVQGHDLRSLASPYLILIFIVAIQITLFLFGVLSLA